MILENLDKNPLRQFEKWYGEALPGAAPLGAEAPDFMTLATATKKGRPSARVVLYKGLNKKGFRFFTNYESRKGREMIENPWAALVIHWPWLTRQVRVEGKIEKLPRKESEEYFHSRPRGSQIGAWASDQSRAIKSREYLEARYRQFEEKFAGMGVPLPPYWGGFCLLPTSIEFWEAGASRLHDRFRYERKKTGTWKVTRLSP